MRTFKPLLQIKEGRREEEKDPRKKNEGGRREKKIQTLWSNVVTQVQSRGED